MSPERSADAPVRRSIMGVRDRADGMLAAEREFVDHLLDTVGRVVDDLKHEVGNLRSTGREDDARAIEDAMRPLLRVHSGVEPDA